jgi:predicted component of viral defense system (DUF524 family)
MLALHQFAVELRNRWQLALEWAEGKGESATPPQNKPPFIACEVETEQDAIGFSGAPAIVFDPHRESFSSIRLREHTDYLVDLLIPTTRAEAAIAWRARPHWPFHDRLARFYRSDPPRRWRDTEAGLIVSGRLNFRSHVGIADLSPDGSGELLIDVVPSKVGFLDDYPAILNAIAAHLTDLLFRAEGPTFAPLQDVAKDRTTLLSVLMQIRRAMSSAGIVSAVEELLYRPRRALMDERTIVPAALAGYADPTEIAAASAAALSLTPGGPLAPLFGGRTPAMLPVRRKTETVDTPENRYVKHFLAELASWLFTLRKALAVLQAPAALSDVARWSTQVSDWQSHPLWADVGPMTHFPSNSQVLQRTSTYRQILDADMALQLAVGLKWNAGFSEADDLFGELKPIDKLYEYWCFFELWAALETICGTPIGSLNVSARVSRGMTVTLKRGAESAVEFRLGDTKVCLYYNRTFGRNKSVQWQNSYSARLSPDFSIRVEGSPADAQVHWIHFDAKYRLDFEQWRSDVDTLAGAEQMIEAYKREDLFKMHTYRDALFGSRASYVLFPGQAAAEDIMVRYPGASYPAAQFSIPSVGAIQMRPDNQDQRATLVAVLRRILTEVSSVDSYREETGFFKTDGPGSR